MAFPIGPGQKVGGPNRSTSFFIGRHLPEGFLTKKEEALPADSAGEVPRARRRILSTEALQLLELERKTSPLQKTVFDEALPTSPVGEALQLLELERKAIRTEALPSGP